MWFSGMHAWNLAPPWRCERSCLSIHTLAHFLPTHTLLPCNKAFVFCIWCSICAPQQQKKLKLPCKVLHPARTWGSHGTCRWSGCSTRSHRSWSIRHWQSTPGRPVTREHSRALSLPLPSSSMPHPLPLPICCGSTGSRASTAVWNSPKAQKQKWWHCLNGSRCRFQQPGTSKNFSETDIHACWHSPSLKHHGSWSINSYALPHKQMPEFTPSPLPSLIGLHKCDCKGQL